MQVYVTSSTAVASSTSLQLAISAWSTTGVSSDNNMLVGPVTLNGPVPSSTPYNAAGATSTLTARTGMMAISTSNWDGYASSTALGTGGFTGTYTNNALVGPWTVINQPSAVGQGNQMILAQAIKQTQSFPTSIPGGYSCFMWFQLYSNDPVQTGVSRNYGFLTVGNAYSVSFWYVQRANGPAGPPVFKVTLGGKTVWNTSPSSTSWVRVQTFGTLINVNLTSPSPPPSCHALPPTGLRHDGHGRRAVIDDAASVAGLGPVVDF